MGLDDLAQEKTTQGVLMVFRHLEFQQQHRGNGNRNIKDADG